MSFYFSQFEVETILDNIKAAIVTVTTGGKSYSLNDGQGVMSVTRSTLSELNTAAEYWQNILDDITSDGSGDIVSMEVG